MKKNAFAVLALTALAFFLDQTTKWLILNVVMAPPRVIEITPFFNLRLGFNTGSASACSGNSSRIGPGS